MQTSDQLALPTGWDGPEDFRLVQEPLPFGGALLIVSGELDIATAPDLRERINAAIDAGAKRLVVDLTGVTFMDSVALAAILHARARLAEGGHVAVAIPRDSYTRLVFEIAGLPQCLDLFETRDEALAHVGA